MWILLYTCIVAKQLSTALSCRFLNEEGKLIFSCFSVYSTRYLLSGTQRSTYVKCFSSVSGTIRSFLVTICYIQSSNWFSFKSTKARPDHLRSRIRSGNCVWTATSRNKPKTFYQYLQSIGETYQKELI